MRLSLWFFCHFEVAAPAELRFCGVSDAIAVRGDVAVNDRARTVAVRIAARGEELASRALHAVIGRRLIVHRVLARFRALRLSRAIQDEGEDRQQRRLSEKCRSLNDLLHTPTLTPEREENLNPTP